MRRKTHKEFIEEMSVINKDIEIIGEYVNNKTEMLCRCKKDDYIWKTTPNRLLRGKGCPKCSKCNRKTTQEFINDINIVNPKIEILGEYVNSKTKIECKCKTCNNIWCATPNSLLRGSGCPVCSQKIRRNIKKTTSEFVIEMNEMNPNIKICGEYVNAKTKILCKCMRDGFEWKAQPLSLLSGCGCPKCSFPKGELSIEKYLQKYNIKYESQKNFDELLGILGRDLLYDFYLPHYNILIEYNGEQHYNPIEFFGGKKSLEKQQEHDRRKREYAKQNNIKLIEIPYWDFENIEEILSKELGLIAQFFYLYVKEIKNGSNSKKH